LNLKGLATMIVVPAETLLDAAWGKDWGSPKRSR
jgi:hypothetical protein